MRNLWQKIWLPLILGLGTLLRLWQLGQRDFWYDEAYTGIVVRQSFAGIIQELVQDVHPPVYFFITHLLAWPFHYSVIGIRLVSVLAGVIAIGFTYLIGRDLFSKRAGLWAAFFTAILPFAIQFSQEARMYTLCTCFLLAATWFFIHALRTDRLRWCLLWGASLGLAFLTHYLSVLFLPLFGIIWLSTRSSFKDLLPSRRGWSGVAVALLLFLPWLDFFLEQLRTRKEKTQWITPAVFGDLFRTLHMFLVGIPKGEQSAGMPFPLEVLGVANVTILTLVSALAILVSWSVWKRYKKTAIIPLLGTWGFMTLIYALSLYDIRYFVARYLLAAAYFFCILLGAWVSSLSRTRALGIAALYVLFLAQVITVSNSQGYNELSRHLGDYSGKHFYALNSFDYLIAKYYFGEERLRLYNVGWPQYDSRSWPGIGYHTNRIEDLNVLLQDPQGVVLWNTQLPIERRDDRWFDRTPFQLTNTYKNLEIYTPRLPPTQ